MKKVFIIVTTSLFILTSCGDKNITHNSDGSVTVNTIEIGNGIRAFGGQLPLNVTFKDDVIKNVEILENHETPDYLDCVEKEMLPKFIDLPISDIDKIDGVSGATFSSKGLRNNIKVAADYYKKNK